MYAADFLASAVRCIATPHRCNELGKLLLAGVLSIQIDPLVPQARQFDVALDVMELALLKHAIAAASSGKELRAHLEDLLNKSAGW